jgi:hypothetical protein
MSTYKGRCAGCGKSWNSKAFKSRREGHGLPDADERMLAFASESEVNNKICGSCNKRNEKLLKAKRARDEEKGARDEEKGANENVRSKQLKPDRANEQDEIGGGGEKKKYARTSRGIVRDADAAVGDVGVLDVDSSEEEDDEVEGDVVLMLLSLATPNV